MKKTKVLFVCLGNICRSPMAEAVFRDMIEKEGLSYYFEIDSAATSAWEVGNPVHHGTRNKLNEVGISTAGMRARQLEKADNQKFDYIIGMEEENVRNILRIFGQKENKKVFRLLDITERPRDIADPWYTGDFEKTYQDVLEGCSALLKQIQKESGEKS